MAENISIVRLSNGETLVAVATFEKDASQVVLDDPCLLYIQNGEDNKQQINFLPYANLTKKVKDAQGNMRTKITIGAFHILYAQRADDEVAQHYTDLVLSKVKKAGIILPENKKKIII